MRFIPILLFIVPTGPAADVWTFETPSENIQCSVGQEADMSDLRCTIIERSGPAALPAPADCMSRWGHVFYVRDTGLVEMICEEPRTDRGGYDRGGYDRADYGVTGRFGGFTCESAKTGLTCRNRDGHGFSLSRASQKVF